VVEKILINSSHKRIYFFLGEFDKSGGLGRLSDALCLLSALEDTEEEPCEETEEDVDDGGGGC
jgi:hypothetical protein